MSTLRIIKSKESPRRYDSGEQNTHVAGNPLREAKDNTSCGYGTEEDDRLHVVVADKFVLMLYQGVYIRSVNRPCIYYSIPPMLESRPVLLFFILARYRNLIIQGFTASTTVVVSNRSYQGISHLLDDRLLPEPATCC